MEQFKRVLERFMPQEGSEDGEAEAGGEAATANKAADRTEAGPHSDADSDEEGEEGRGPGLLQLLSTLQLCG